MFFSKDNMKLTWMIDGEQYSITLAQFSSILGLKAHFKRDKKLHDECVLGLPEMNFVYESSVKHHPPTITVFCHSSLCSIGWFGRLWHLESVIPLGFLSMKGTSCNTSKAMFSSMPSTSSFRRFGALPSLHLGLVTNVEHKPIRP
jgi:hypothetical protein